MRTRRTVSVAMAVYNGETYLKEQMDSILSQLGVKDEVILSLDPSTDRTLDIIKDYCLRDSRVHMCWGPGRGVIKNFENAIKHCRNEIIFLADQDDVWKSEKVEKVLMAFKDSEVMVVLHDSEVVDEKLNILQPSFFDIKQCRPGVVKNIIKNSYIGCCMAFRRKCSKYFLPFPARLPMHDQWIGLCCESLGKATFIDEPLLMYRRHGENLSGMNHASVFQMLNWRIELVWALCLRKFLKR
ncbi:glycosyltransferase family 2 protein [Frisingicoccus sp.]|uniref:glycosyltransferase family 2 protein n=1 Tax=Frisingicoccus sp. TaxID=1918627 RepID=UPI002E76B782|nr:glycosyltransferase family 2 protein [Frisingicoccus sp.]MEE0751421.1 glycosyltransferase family 2 protein [Frisingicoccus sp.]